MKRAPRIAGVLIFGGMALATASGAQASRLEWHPESCELSHHRLCVFAQHPPEPSDSHRFVTLRGSLRSFAPGDAALYAVYLTEPGDLARLRGFLDRLGSPASWSGDPEGSRFLEERAALEWIPIETNGTVVVRADEAHVPGKRWVAVVNTEGEILGAHPLWAVPGPVASLPPASATEDP